MTDHAAIIRREFAKAANCDPSALVIEFNSDDVTIRVTFEGNTFVCECEACEDEFVFACTTEACDDIVFPVPADYLNVNED